MIRVVLHPLMPTIVIVDIIPQANGKNGIDSTWKSRGLILDGVLNGYKDSIRFLGEVN